MFSTTVEYALRAVIHLAHEYPRGRTTAQIAEATRVPKDYLSKVLQTLAVGGIVRTQRGTGGGVTLARLPAEISLLEVVNGVGAFQRITTCPLGIETHGPTLCALHRRMDAAMGVVETVFRDTTLAEVTGELGELPLCDGVGQPNV